VKRLALVLTVLFLCGGVAFATDSTTATTKATEPKVEDFNPNPYEAKLAESEKALTAAYDKLEKLYNSFDFDQLIAAYYEYAKSLGVWQEYKKRFDAFETAYPFKLVLNVRGFNLAEKTEDVDYPMCPNDVEDKDDNVINAFRPVRTGVQAKIALESAIAGQKITKNFETNDKGYLGVKHFSKGQALTLKADAEGYLTYKTKLKMDKNTKKLVNLEVLTAGLKGHVYGLPKVEAAGQPIWQRLQKIPLVGATLSFKHSTGKTYVTKTLGTAWPFKRLVPLAWNPANGRYFKARMVAGAYEVTVTKDGYRPFHNKMTLEAAKPDAYKVQDFVLVPMFDYPLAKDGNGSDGTSGTGTNNLDNPLQ
jgi:hypothetical protein